MAQCSAIQVYGIHGARSCKAGGKKGRTRGTVKPVPRGISSKGISGGAQSHAGPVSAAATNGHRRTCPDPAALNGFAAAAESAVAPSTAPAQTSLQLGRCDSGSSSSLDQGSDYAAETLAKQLQYGWPVRDPMQQRHDDGGSWQHCVTTTAAPANPELAHFSSLCTSLQAASSHCTDRGCTPSFQDALPVDPCMAVAVVRGAHRGARRPGPRRWCR